MLNEISSLLKASNAPQPTTTNLGQRFKTGREKMQLSTLDVANRLRLKPNIIEMIESDNFKKSPPRIFIRGYVRSYGKLLSFSEKEIKIALEELQKHLPVYVKKQESIKPEKYNQINHWNWLSYALILASIICICLWVAQR